MGKFPNDTVEALHRWSLNGFCDNSGNVEAPTGWYCRIDVDAGVLRQINDETVANLVDNPLQYDPDELLGYWMLYEDNQGFVDAERFPNAPQRDRVWDRLERQYGTWDNNDL